MSNNKNNEDNKKNFDKERIIELISIINENLKFIKDENIKSPDKLKESKKDYLAISMALFSILNKVIELGEEILEGLNKNIYPKTYFEIPKLLLENKIIDSQLHKKILEFIEYRNNIAHEYEIIMENEIFWCITNLNHIDEFLKITKELIKK